MCYMYNVICPFLEKCETSKELFEEHAQLRLCKLGPGTVLIFYKSLAPTPIYK